MKPLLKIAVEGRSRYDVVLLMKSRERSFHPELAFSGAGKGTPYRKHSLVR